jgi:SNF2 family DNA or RNA helicase
MQLDSYLEREYILLHEEKLNIQFSPQQKPILLNIFGCDIQIYDWNEISRGVEYPRFHSLIPLTNCSIIKQLKPFMYHNHIFLIYPFENWELETISQSNFIKRHVLWDLEFMLNENIIFIKLSSCRRYISTFIKRSILDKFSRGLGSYKYGIIKIIEYCSKINMEKKFINYLSDNISKNTINVTFTEDCIDTLYSHQIENIKWMMDTESKYLNCDYTFSQDKYIKIGDYIVYNNDIFIEEDFSRLQIEKQQKKIRFSGAYLCDSMGMGKTATCIGLTCGINSIELDQRDRSTICAYRYKKGIKSGKLCEGTTIEGSVFCKKHKDCFLDRWVGRTSSHHEVSLVICPSHITNQWANEFIRFTNGRVNLLVITTITQFEILTQADLEEVDVIILSYQFLVNKNYISLDENKKLHRQIPYFKRIFFDELHEMYTNKKIFNQLHLLSENSRFNWIVTGTPISDNYENLYQTFLLVTRTEESFHTISSFVEFYSNLFRRNVSPNLQASLIVKETKIGLVFTDTERCIYDSYAIRGRKASTEFLTKLCTHSQLIDNTRCQIKQCKSFAEIKEVILDFCKKEIEEEEEMMERLVDEDKKKRQNEILRSYYGTLNYLQNFQIDQNEDCPICLESIDKNSIVVTKCGHKFCYKCIDILSKNSNYGCVVCPQCKEMLNPHLHIYSIYSIYSDKSQCNSSEYWVEKTNSTKIGNIIYYLKNLKSDDKVIFFSQWQEMLDKIEEILSENGIIPLNCAGTVHQRNRSIQLFTQNKDYKIILLSSKLAASGANLTQANKIIFLEPIFGDKTYRKDVEAQAISRSLRIGQKKPLEVVRFYIKDTIEEDILLDDV